MLPFSNFKLKFCWKGGKIHRIHHRMFENSILFLITPPGNKSKTVRKPQLSLLWRHSHIYHKTKASSLLWTFSSLKTQSKPWGGGTMTFVARECPVSDFQGVLNTVRKCVATVNWYGILNLFQTKLQAD